MTNNIKTDNAYIQERREGRVIAFQTLFMYDFNPKPLEVLLNFEWLENKYPKGTLEYAAFLVKGTLENLLIIDEKIKTRLRNWEFNRISHVDKAVLRFSIYSMLFEKDLPEKVIINEAVEIVKSYGAKDSYKFINGILDAIKRSKGSGE